MPLSKVIILLCAIIASVSQASCSSRWVETIPNRAIDPTPELLERFRVAAADPDLLSLSLARAECVKGGIAIWLNLSGRSLNRVVHGDSIVFSRALVDRLRISETFEVLDTSGRVVEWEAADLPDYITPEFEDAARSRTLLATPPTYYPGDSIQDPLRTTVPGVVSQLFYISVQNAAPGFTVRFKDDHEITGVSLEQKMESIRLRYGGFSRFEILNRSIVVGSAPP